MHDYKNIFIAWASTTSSMLTAVEMKTLLTIISAIVLPVIFFTIGKTVDVAVQVYFRRRAEPPASASGRVEGKELS
jgi:hypothetical protein